MARAILRWLVGAAVMLGLLAMTVAASGCASSGQESSIPPGDEPFRAFGNMTTFADEMVWAAYRYAVSNPQVLQYIPCYCGCGSQGHASNRDCYIKGVAADGSLQYERHAVGCVICIGITRDVMRLEGEGKSLKEIRSYVDATWSRYGPATATPLPPEG